MFNVTLCACNLTSSCCYVRHSFIINGRTFLQALGDFVRERYIRFFPDPLPGHWPTPHSKTLNIVQDLGATRFEFYRQCSKIREDKEPAMTERMMRANDLAKAIHHAIDEGQDDPEWQSLFDSHVFEIPIGGLCLEDMFAT